MSVIDTQTIQVVDESREPAKPMGRRQVATIVTIGYLAAAGAVLATLLLPAG